MTTIYCVDDRKSLFSSYKNYEGQTVKSPDIDLKTATADLIHNG